MMSAENLWSALRVTEHSALLSQCHEPAINKTRRIIDEWDTGVKRKISLSFKEIIDISRSREDAGSELRLDVSQVPGHGGPAPDWTGDMD
jgi:hypothetical protein